MIRGAARLHSHELLHHQTVDVPSYIFENTLTKTSLLKLRFSLNLIASVAPKFLLQHQLDSYSNLLLAEHPSP